MYGITILDLYHTHTHIRTVTHKDSHTHTHTHTDTMSLVRVELPGVCVESLGFWAREMKPVVV